VARQKKNRQRRTIFMVPEAWQVVDREVEASGQKVSEWLESVVMDYAASAKKAEKSALTSPEVEAEIEGIASALAALVRETDPEAIALVQVRLRAFAVALTAGNN